MFKSIATTDPIKMENLEENTKKILDYLGIKEADYNGFDYAHNYKCNYLCDKLIGTSEKIIKGGSLNDSLDKILMKGRVDIGVEKFSAYNENKTRLSSFFDDDDLDEDDNTTDTANELEGQEADRILVIQNIKQQIKDWILSSEIVLPREIQAKVTNYASAQIEAIKKLPWFSKENKPMQLKDAEKILNKNIYGLDEVKKHVLQYIAAQLRTESNLGTVLLFDGPPGIGKTSIATAIAEAMNRQLYVIKLPVYSTAWEICGLDKSWKGAKPGLIIDALIKTKSAAPVILLDEIDKIKSAAEKDSGNISAALLTVLDSNRSNYMDSFLQIGVDLSQVVFLATSNDIHAINPILLDRLKIIPLKGYTADHKKDIAQKFIIPQTREKYKLYDDELVIENDAMQLLVQQYATEPGVRTLMHDLDSIFSYATKFIEDHHEKLIIDKDKVLEIIGEPRVKSYSVGTVGGIGDCFSMDFYDINGRFDIVQATVYPGKGQIKKTGAIDNKEIDEAILIVMSHIKKFSLLYGIEYELLCSSDIHINFLSNKIINGQEYALSIFVAIICALKGWATESWVFLGRLSLNGSIFPPEQLSDKIASFSLSDKVEKFITAHPNRTNKDLKIPENKELVYLDTTMEVFDWIQKKLKGV